MKIDECEHKNIYVTGFAEQNYGGGNFECQSCGVLLPFNYFYEKSK